MRYALPRRCFNLLLLFLVCTSLPGQSGPEPEAIFYNGKVISVDANFSIHQAFAIKSGRFAAVGSDRAIRSLAGDETRQINLRGHAVIPGLMDNHNHQYHAGLVILRGVDLEGVRAISEMLERLQDAAGKAEAGDAIYGSMGWLPSNLSEGRPPTRHDLDAVSSEHPVVVYQTRGLAYLNSAALARLGITRESRSLGKAVAALDEKGELSGTFRGVPYAVLGPTSAMAEVSREEMKNSIVAIQKRQLAIGLTSVRDLQLTPEAMRAYFELWREGRMIQRVSIGLELNPHQAGQAKEMLSSWGIETGFGDHWLRLDGIAEFNPGTMFREPFASRPDYSGTPNLPFEAYRDVILLANRLGWRPSPHVAGDKALDWVLDAYEAADREDPIRDKRWIVEHALLSHPEQMERLKQLGVAISAQLQPYYSAERLLEDWGKARAERALPLREWLDHGLIVSSGSDWPGHENNPFVTIYFYVSRNAPGYGPIGLNQNISRAEALRVATVNNAYLTFEEKEKGSIETGKLADFLILSADILTLPEEDIPSIIPLATYVDGRRMVGHPSSRF